MKAVLKEIFSPDLLVNADFIESDDNFGLMYEAFIGNDTEDGHDLFTFFVCTPNWLKDNRNEEDVFVENHVLIVFEFNPKAIEKYIASYCSRCIGTSWNSIAFQLGSVMRWEYAEEQRKDIIKRLGTT